MGYLIDCVLEDGDVACCDYNVGPFCCELTCGGEAKATGATRDEDGLWIVSRVILYNDDITYPPCNGKLIL